MALGTVLRRGGHSADASIPERAQSHRLLERLGVTDMSYLFNSMVNFNADISALGLTGHIRVYVVDMMFYVPTNITRLEIGCNPPGNNTGLQHLWNLSVPLKPSCAKRVVQSGESPLGLLCPEPIQRRSRRTKLALSPAPPHTRPHLAPGKPASP